MTIAVIAVIGAFGCSDFSAIDRGVCGNGLLDPGEDCDSSAASCSSCSITCDLTACPSGFTCGVDQLCHAPGGRLTTDSIPSPYAVDEMRITDIDEDGIGDVLGVSRTALDVRYGDATGSLVDGDRVLTPIQGGVPGFADIDGDGALDVGFGTSDGVVVYTSPFGKLSPLSIRQQIGVDGVQIASLFTINPAYFGFIVAYDQPGPSFHKLEMLISSSVAGGGVIGATGGLGGMTVQQLCGGKLTDADFVPDRVETYVASTFEVATIPVITDLVVTFTGGSATGPKTCATAVHINLFEANPGDVVKFHDITPLTLPNDRVTLARLDANVANPCPALVVPDLASNRVLTWPAAEVGGATPHCTVGAMVPFTFSNVVPSTPSSDAQVIGSVALDPPVVFPVFGGTDLTFGRDAIVMFDGIYAPIANTTQFARIYRTTRPARRMATGDFDGDGDVDLVTTNDGEDDLDVLYRSDYSFQQLRVDSAGQITHVLTGDFDGNAIADIAYVEPVLGHERLMIAYGTNQRIDPSIEVETFKHVTFMSLVGFGGSLDQTNVIDDIIVVDQPAAHETYLTLLSGSLQRTMLSYFDPRSTTIKVMGAPDRIVSAEASLVGVVFGRFTGGAVVAAVLGIATTLYDSTISPNGAPPAVPARVWPMNVDTTGLTPIENGQGLPITSMVGCTASTPQTSTDVCLPATRYTVWPLEAGDVVIAIDKQQLPRAAVVSGGASTPAPVLTAAVPMGATVRSFHAVDLDGDATRELLVSFGATGDRDAKTAGLVELCAIDAAGVPTSCENVGDAIEG
ncbi:MAG: VCBS repeat-containing protein, partial [Proteobacteria bacterium]|nr:VCBS repeat-containing protein [Pseudomonadota bacterium]